MPRKQTIADFSDLDDCSGSDTDPDHDYKCTKAHNLPIFGSPFSRAFLFLSTIVPTICKSLRSVIKLVKTHSAIHVDRLSYVFNVNQVVFGGFKQHLPVINEASSDTRKETVFAISSGLPKRLNFVADFIYGIIKNSVSTKPALLM